MTQQGAEPCRGVLRLGADLGGVSTIAAISLACMAEYLQISNYFSIAIVARVSKITLRSSGRSPS